MAFWRLFTVINMTIKIVVSFNNKKFCLSCEEGEPVSHALRTHKLLQLPCGGAGTCGKCLIYADTEPHPQELKRLTPAAINNGLRLACYTPAQNGLKLQIPHRNAAKVLTSFSSMDYGFKPIVTKKEITIRTSTLENQQTDIENLLEFSNSTSHRLNLKQQARLPEFLLVNKTGYALTQEKALIGIDTHKAHTLLAIDIGTTTVAGILFDLNNRAVIDVFGELNDQAPFGADVISRIHNTIGENSSGSAELQQAIVNQISKIKKTLVNNAVASGMDISDPSMIAITGNTSMIHFLCGLPTENIGKAPFIPVTLEPMTLHSSDLKISSNAPVFIMPGISAYVGADIVAALLAADAHKTNTPFLLVDFGTNAEIVLSDGTKFYACSTAAGPCFEGASLACGSVAEPGAIDTVFKAGEDISYTTIDQSPARSICGSAVIDCIAKLLDSGTIDETGRFDKDAQLADRLTDINDETVFMISDSVYLSQSDIRKVQLAKAAVRAGIETLFKEADICAEKIETLFIAGGFGAALNPANAVRIGMLPRQIESIVRPLGNAAGSGAVRYVTEDNAFTAVTEVKAKTTYIELSCHAEFTNEYVMQMTFPERVAHDKVVNY